MDAVGGSWLGDSYRSTDVAIHPVARVVFGVSTILPRMTLWMEVVVVSQLVCETFVKVIFACLLRVWHGDCPMFLLLTTLTILSGGYC